MDDDISPITVDRDDEDVLVSLWHPSLDERLRALQTIAVYFEFHEHHGIKPGLLRCIARELVACFLSDNFTEKKFRSHLLDTIAHNCKVALPFDNCEVTAEVLLSSVAGVSLPAVLCSTVRLAGVLLHQHSAQHGSVHKKLLALVGEKYDALLNASVSRDKYVVSAQHAVHALLMPLLQNHNEEITAQLLASHRYALLAEAHRISPNPLLSEQFFSYLVTSIKTPLSVTHQFAVVPLLASVSQEQWTTLGADTSIAKFFKKSPDLAASVVSFIMAHVFVDLSGIVSECLSTATLQRLLKSTNPDTRSALLSIIRSIAMKSSAASLGSLLVQLKDMMSVAAITKDAKASILLCISAVGESPHVASGALTSALCELLPALVAVMEKEVDDNMRVCVAHAVVSFASDDVSLQQLVNLLAAMLTAKRNVPSALIVAAQLVHRNVPAIALLPLQSTLLSMLKDVKKSSVVSYDTLFVVLVLLFSSGTDAETVKALAKFATADCFLYNVNMIAGMKISDEKISHSHLCVTSACHVLSVMIIQHNDIVASCVDAASTVLMTCLALPQYVVYSAAAAVVAKHLHADVYPCEARQHFLTVLLSALQSHIAKLVVPTNSSAAVAVGEEILGTATRSSECLPPSHFYVLLKLLLSNETYPAEAVSSLLAIVSHPIVHGSSRKRLLQLVQHFLLHHNFALLEHTLASLASSTDIIVAQLYAMLFSANPTQRSAACYYVIALENLGSDIQIGILNKLFGHLEHDTIATVPTTSLQVYLNPTAAPTSAAEVTITNADRKKSAGRSRRTAFGTDDEEYLEQIKREKLQKLSQQETGVQAIIEQVSGILDGMRRHFATMSQLVSLESVSLKAVSPVYLHVLHTLLLQEVTADIATQALEVIVFYLCDGALKHMKREILASILLIFKTLQRPLKKGETRSQLVDAFCGALTAEGPYARCLHFLKNISSAKNLVLSSEWGLIPVFFLVEASLDAGILIPDADQGLFILDSFWSSCITADSEVTIYLLPHTIQLLLRCLVKHKISSPSPDLLLYKYISQRPLRTNEVELLLTEGVLSSNQHVQVVSLKALYLALSKGGTRVTEFITSRVWLMQHCVQQDAVEAASMIWEQCGLTLTSDFMSQLLPLLNVSSAVAAAAAKAIAHGVSFHPETIATIIDTLTQIYNSSLPPDTKSPAVPDAKNMIRRIPVAVEDTFITQRLAVAYSFNAIIEAKLIPSPMAALEFLLHSCDKQTSVQEAMQEAAKNIIKLYGLELKDEIIPLLQNVIAASQPTKDNVSNDSKYESTVILLASYYQHLSKDDPTLLVILELLLKALKAPVERIQKAVADNLIPVVQTLKPHEVLSSTLATLLTQVVEKGPQSTYGTRRGAAYGIAAIVKGLGIVSLKDHNIIPMLKDYCATGGIEQKQGSLFTIELLSEKLGLLFEPYIITLIPLLLSNSSHTSDHVRNAAQQTMQRIMNNLSGHAVKQILNPVLQTLQTESVWKIRQEALLLMGKMAHCAPKQLGTYLPTIIPPLLTAANDSHPKVKASALAALKDISSVIRNPEIANISNSLLDALCDQNKTTTALNTLLNTHFQHAVDAPSLALVVPVLVRAVKDRAGENKRKGAIIMGNICDMITDPKILLPYLNQMLECLHSMLLDPIPDIRTTSAKALRSIAAGVGAGPSLTWLQERVVAGGDVAGVSQGLAEVIAVVEEQERMSILLPLLQGATGSAVSIEGALWVLVFLPVTLQDNFSDYIGVSLPLVLNGLCSDNDLIREVAYRAGQVIVTVSGRKYTSNILPVLVRSCFNIDWRIRHAAVMLMGELLYMIGEIKANDDNNSHVMGLLHSHIGDVNDVLVALFICRSDSSKLVRQSALMVWKTVVSNSAKAVKDILSELINKLIELLCDDDEELKLVASRSLVEVIKKFGDVIIPLLLPYLNSVDDTKEDHNMGICIALHEICKTCTSKQVEVHMQQIMECLLPLLASGSSDVRQASGMALVSLYSTMGGSSIAPMFDVLSHSELAEVALRTAVHNLPSQFLEFYLPTVMDTMLSEHDCRILGIVVDAAATEVSAFYPAIISTLMHNLLEGNNGIEAACAMIMSSVQTPALPALLQCLAAYINEATATSSTATKRYAILLFSLLFQHAKVDYGQHIVTVQSLLLPCVVEQDKELLTHLLAALSSMATSIATDALVEHIVFMRNTLLSIVSETKHRVNYQSIIVDGRFMVPLLMLPKSLEPFIPIYMQGLMTGSDKVREAAAQGIGEVIQWSDAAVLKPYLVKVTGALIRVAGDRMTGSVKFAVLQTMSLLIQRGGIGLKAFAPQLQTTFLKSLPDPSKQVRQQACACLSHLMPLLTRVDVLVTELATAGGQGEGVTLRASYWEALEGALARGGEKVSAPVLEQAAQLLLPSLLETDEHLRLYTGRAASTLARFVPASVIGSVMASLLAIGRGESSEVSASRCYAVVAVLRGAGERGTDIRDTAMNTIIQWLQTDDVVIRTHACSAVGGLFLVPISHPSSDGDKQVNREHLEVCEYVLQRAGPVLAGNALAGSSAMTEGITMLGAQLETRRAAVAAIKTMCKARPGLCASHAGMLAAAIVGYLQHDSHLMYKRPAERALKYLLGITHLGELKHHAVAMQHITNKELAKFCSGYAKRVLVSLGEESDEEYL